MGPPDSRYDIVVVGLGVTGSAALAALARRGLRVLGIEQFDPGHDRGSSHGATRIIRLSYFEHPSYVPLLRAALAGWRTLEHESGAALFEATGILEMGRPDGDLISGTLAASRLHNLVHEVLAPVALRQRWPALRPADDMIGVFQPDGGYLRAEAAIAAMLAVAQRHGAALRTRTPVRSLAAQGDGVRIVTDDGIIAAGAAIVAVGPWLPQWLPNLLPQHRLPLRVTRQVLGWFAPSRPVPGLPTFLIETARGLFYGFPQGADAIGDGHALKIAKHHHFDQTVTVDAVDRTVHEADLAPSAATLAAHLPAAAGPCVHATTCLYTDTPDGDFLIDRLPGAPQIVLASPCSGHGFKFAPVIGEALADLTMTGSSRHDMGRFGLSRFG